MNIRHLPLLLTCILGTITASISHASEVDNWEFYARIYFTDIEEVNVKIYLATSVSCLLIYDNITGEFSQLTKVNSDIHSVYTTCLLSDTKNRLWVGTKDNGVAMRDKDNWMIYDTLSAPVFKNCKVLKIKEEPNGSIWFFTRVNRSVGRTIEFHNNKWTSYEFTQQNSPFEYLTDIAFDSTGGFWAIGSPSSVLGYFNGNKWFEYTQYDSCHCFRSIEEINYSRNKLWVLTYSNGLFVLQDSIWTEYSRNTNHLIGRYYRDMLLTSDSTCWVLSDSCLSYFDSYSWTNYSFINYGLNTDEYDPYKISALNDSIVVGYFNFYPQGIFIFDKHNLETKLLEDYQKFRAYSIWAINFENANTTWVSTYNGLHSYTNGEWDVYKYNGYGTIRPNAIDHNGIVWIGTYGNGVHSLDRSTSTWSHYTTETSELPADPIRAIAVDSQNRKWIGTWSGGFAIFDDDEDTWEIFNTDNSPILDNDVTLIFIEEDETVWIGTYGGGISRISQNEWTNYTTSNSLLPSNNIVAINQHPDGSIWVGTNGKGLIRIEGEEMTIFDQSNSGIPDDHVGGIAFDSEGKVWVSTYEGGIASYDGTNWNVFNTLNSPLSTDYIWCLNIDSDDTKWIGTWGGGLFLYNENGISEIDIDEVQNHVPKLISISNYPNPFNISTTISFKIPSSGGTSIEVFDLRGKFVKTLLNKELRKGSYEIQFNADKLSTGIYICKISTQSSHIRHHNTRKLLLIK